VNEPLYALYHVEAPDPCGGVAFYATRVLQTDDVLDSTTVRLLDGSAPVDGETEMRCGTCNASITGPSACYWRRYWLEFQRDNGAQMTVVEDAWDAGDATTAALALVREHYANQRWKMQSGRYETLYSKDGA
jgi:hypothetical protein